MKNRLLIDFANSRIVMDRTFAEKCRDTRSTEYAHLQQVRQDYPLFSVQRREIKKNPTKETYAGLTYAYMERYIATHEEGEAFDAVMDEYNELRLISECHRQSRRYPTIKKWFLEKYPQIAEFGLEKEESTEMPHMEAITGMAEQPSATQKMAS